MWHDAIDCAPRFIFDVQLKDGSVVEAHHIMGSFETHDGQVLYPEKFRFKECRVVIPVSGMPRNLTPRAADGAYRCENCNYPEEAHPTPGCVSFQPRRKR